jgi:hypothetical protein
MLTRFFSATYQGLYNPLALSYNSDGILAAKLPQGPETDSYKVYIHVNIIDESYGFTTFQVANPVQVYPNTDLTQTLFETALTKDPRNPAVVSLNTGNLKTVASFVTTLTAEINMKGSPSVINATDNETISQLNKKAELREVLINQLKDMPISDISSIKLFSTALSSSTQDTKEISRSAAVISSFFLF